MTKGRVIKSTGSITTVETESGDLLECRVRGKLRQAGMRSTNPVAVGDRVKVEGGEGGHVISAVEPRTNYIVRKSVNLSKESHIIASNLDRAVLIATMREPMTFPVFIDRFCVAAEAYHIPVAVVFNKVDLLDKEERELLENFMSVYADLGYETLACSAVTGEGKERFRTMLEGKVSLLSGHSGAGKSSLINALDPGLDIRVGQVSDAHRTGKHTTTYAEMHKLSEGTFIVDTPGIRGFGLIDFEREELAGYFPEMRALLSECKFYNCRHLTEPGCAVKEGVKSGKVAETRYKSYLNMYEENEGENYR